MFPTFPKHLKFGTLGYTRLDYRSYFVREDGTRFYDSETALVMLLSQFLNFTFTYVSAKDGKIGQPQDDGNWNGVFGLVQRGECDLTVVPILISEERAKAVNFSYPYLFTRITFMTQKPQPLPKNLAVFYPFSFSLWITLIIFIFSFSLLFSIMYFGGNKKVRTLLSVLGSTVGQPLTIKLASGRHKIAFLGWTIGISFLLYSYKAVLLSFLFRSPLKGITTIAELSSAVNSGFIKCMTFKGSFVINALLTSSDESIRIIGQSLKDNSNEGITQRNCVQDTAIVTLESTLGGNSLECFVSEDTFFSAFIGIPLHKDFCCKKVLDKTLKTIFETGLYGKHIRDLNNLSHILAKKIYLMNEKQNVLTLNDIQGAVALLLFGYILSFLVLIVEKCITK